MNQVNGMRLKAGEAEIIRSAIHGWTGKTVGFRIAAFGNPVQLHTARIGNPHGTCGFVERFSCSVVARAAKDAQLCVAVDGYNMSMAS